jgi:hypothetical protein
MAADEAGSTAYDRGPDQQAPGLIDGDWWFDCALSWCPLHGLWVFMDRLGNAASFEEVFEEEGGVSGKSSARVWLDRPRSTALGAVMASRQRSYLQRRRDRQATPVFWRGAKEQCE